MSVEVYKDRKAVVLQWEAGDYEGPVTIETANVADLSDVSSTELVANPGFAAVSFPLDYEGEFNVSVRQAGGPEIDSGTVAVV